MTYNLKSELLELMHEIMIKNREIIEHGDYNNLLSLCEQDITILGLLRQNQNITAKGLSEDLVVPTTTIITAVTRLEKRGYLNKKQNIEDKRELYLELTTKGEKANEEHYQYEKLIMESLVSRWDEKDQKALAELIHRRGSL